MNLEAKLKKERRIKKLRALVHDLRVKWYDHEDAGKLRRNKRLQHTAYTKLLKLYKQMGADYKPGQMIEVKKYLHSIKDWKNNPRRTKRRTRRIKR